MSQTFHKTPSYGPGSQLLLANGRCLYLTPTTEFPTWCVEGVSAGTGSWRASVVCHRGGIPHWVSQWNKGTFIQNRIMLYTKIISHKVSATRDRYVSVRSHLTTSTPKHQILFNQILKKLSGGNLLHNWHTYTYIQEETHLKNYPIFLYLDSFWNWYPSMIYLVWRNNCNQNAIQHKL